MSQHTEQIRLSLFFPPGGGQKTDALLDDLWKAIADQEPANVQGQPRLGSLTYFLPAGSMGQMFLAASPSRLDFGYAPNVEVDPALGEVPQVDIGQSSLVWPIFKEQCTRLIGRAPSPARVAIGGAFGLPVDSIAAGYKKVKELVPYLPLEYGVTTDLFYRINRPINSQVVPGLSLNRLFTWAVLTRKQFSFALGSGQQPLIEGGTYHVRIEADVNTSAEFVLAPGSGYAALLEELMARLTERLERGET
jgi:hypothetical protein